MTQKKNKQSIITAADVDRLRRKIQPGDRIRFREPVLYTEENYNTAHNRYRTAKGTVVKKFSHQVLVERSGGGTTTVTYVDILLREKRKL